MMEGEWGGTRFRDWYTCPECDEREGVASLAKGTDIVLECYSCGLTAEYVIGRDIPLDDLDIEAIQEIAKRTGDSSV